MYKHIYYVFCRWHPAKDDARGLKECVRRLYTQAYDHSWSEIPNSILQAMFNNFKVYIF